MSCAVPDEGKLRALLIKAKEASPWVFPFGHLVSCSVTTRIAYQSGAGRGQGGGSDEGVDTGPRLLMHIRNFAFEANF